MAKAILAFKLYDENQVNFQKTYFLLKGLNLRLNQNNWQLLSTASKSDQRATFNENTLERDSEKPRCDVKIKLKIWEKD